MTNPNEVFYSIRADEIAECWDGVSVDLYRTLWEKIVPLQKAIPNLEDSGPADHIGHEHLAAHWDVLTDADHVHLNELAIRNGHDDWHDE